MSDIELPDPVAWRWKERDRFFDWTSDWTHHDRAKAMGCEIEYAYAIADREKRAQAAPPHAYAVYFPDQPCEELVHDLDELLDDMTNREHTVTPLFATEASKPVQAKPQCQGDPGECAFNKACMYRCGRIDPPVQAEAPTASNAELEASYTATTLAEMILSDCGHSTENTRLLERVAKRIDKYADTIGDARAALAQVPEQVAGDSELLDWLTEQLVDTIYLDDGRIIDVGTGRIGQTDVRISPHDLRSAIRAACTSGEAAK